MSKEVVYNGGGIGFIGLLTIALLVLKILGYIHFWLWVFVPMILSAAFVFGSLLLIAIIAVFAARR